MTSARVFLVDDHQLFLSGVRAELGDAVDVVGAASDVAAAIEMIRERTPDVVLVDVHMPAGGGARVITEVLESHPDVRFLALSVSDAPEDVIATIRAGARGYVTKTIAPDELVDAIKRVRGGDAVFSPRLAGFVLDAFASAAPPATDSELEQLTPREREVLRLIARGYAYKEVARDLGISVKTVETHVSSVLRKLQLSSRHQLARWASDRRLDLSAKLLARCSVARQWDCRCVRRSNRCSRSSRGSCRPAVTCSSSRSGTASAVCCSATATASTCNRATRSRCCATSPSSSSRCSRSFPSASCSMASSSFPTTRASTSTRSSCASIRRCLASRSSPMSFRRATSRSTCSRSATTRCSTRRSKIAARRSRRCSKKAEPPLFLTPGTTDRETAAEWFARFEGAGFDGVVAKSLHDTYHPGQRAMVKVKHERTCDCVVAGFRVHKDGKGVGSLLCGLYDDDGTLHHVGVASGMNAKFRTELRDDVEPLRKNALKNHPWKDWAAAMHDAAAQHQRMPGGPSRWNANKDLSWEPVRIERVVEVTYEGLMNGRFRHNARFHRWRPDKEPDDCTYAQLETVAPAELREMFA